MEHNRENLLELIRSGLEHHKLSIAALERQAGVAKDTIRDFLRGKTQVLRADKLQKILRILKPEEKVFITGKVGKDSEIFSIPPEPANALDCPPGFTPSDITAVRIEGDAMLPVFHNGWIIYYSTEQGDTEGRPVEGGYVPYNKPVSPEAFSEVVGKPCVVKLIDGRVFLRMLKRGSKPDRYTLVGYNTSEIQDAEIMWVAKILFIRTL